MRMIKVSTYTCILVLTLCIVVLVGCGGTPSVQTPASARTLSTPAGQTADPTPAGKAPTPTQTLSISTEQPVPVGNSNQASGSDIPDTQVFIKYASASGKYQLDVPEGWAQTTRSTDVTFVSNLNTMQATLTDVSTLPTANSVRTDQIVTLQRTGRAVLNIQVQDKHLPNGPAIFITYTSNSDPNAVTGKQVRLENNRYLFFHNGKLATLTLSAPVGADNVDQWARIAGSFKWE